MHACNISSTVSTYMLKDNSWWAIRIWLCTMLLATCTICIWLCTKLLHVPYVYGCVQCSFLLMCILLTIYCPSSKTNVIMKWLSSTETFHDHIGFRAGTIIYYIDFAIYQFCNISIYVPNIYQNQYGLNRYRIHMAIIECIYLSHALFQFWSIVTCMWKCTVVWAVCYWIPIQPTTQYIDIISNSQ